MEILNLLKYHIFSKYSYTYVSECLQFTPISTSECTKESTCGIPCTCHYGLRMITVVESMQIINVG